MSDDCLSARIDLMKRIKETLEEKFWKRVIISDEFSCWNWTGSMHIRGYGLISVDGLTKYAHHIALVLKGVDVDNLTVKHHCNNRSCVNPRHLFTVPKRAGLSLEARFWLQTDKRGADECWKWKGYIAQHGYGCLKGRNDQGSIYAHRISVEISGRVTPSDKVVDHLCNNRWCVNPQHLAIVSSLENVIRSDSPNMKAYRTGMCKRGHSITSGRSCRDCAAIYARIKNGWSRDLAESVPINRHKDRLL